MSTLQRTIWDQNVWSRIGGVLIASLFLGMTGCSNRGVVDQSVGGNALFDLLTGDHRVAGLATTASYRTVIVDTEENRVCPEPPPDVGQAVTQLISLTAEGEVNATDHGNAEGEIDAIRKTIEKITPLLDRTAAIQFYRDARSYNCFAHMNGALTEEEVREADKEVLEVAKLLLLAEIAKEPDDFSPKALSADVEKLEKELSWLEGKITDEDEDE